MPRLSKSVKRAISSLPRRVTRSMTRSMSLSTAAAQQAALARARQNPTELIEAYSLLDAHNRERQALVNSSLVPVAGGTVDTHSEQVIATTTQVPDETQVPQVPDEICLGTNSLVNSSLVPLVPVVVPAVSNAEQVVALTARVSTPSHTTEQAAFEVRADTPSPVQGDALTPVAGIPSRRIARVRSPRNPIRSSAVAGPSTRTQRTFVAEETNTPTKHRRAPTPVERSQKRMVLGEMRPADLLNRRLAPARENDNSQEGGRGNRENHVPAAENQIRRRYQTLVTVQGDGIGDDEALLVALDLSREEAR